MATLVLQHSPHAGILRLGEVLLDYGHKLRTIALHDGEPLPADLDNVDAIVSCGGTPSANDDSLEWLNGEMELLREAHARELPIVGLCLGCQILARALGGTVGPVENKIFLGWHDVALNPVGREDPLHSGIAWVNKQFHWNREQVTELPAGARLLATANGCTVQAWTSGLRTYGFQYHPEIFEKTIDIWMEDDLYALEEAGITREELLKQTKEYFPDFERITDRMFQHMALLLMPVDRRYKGIVKELHH